MDPNLVDYFTINCAISSKIGIENRYQIDFSNPDMGPKILIFLCIGHFVNKLCESPIWESQRCSLYLQVETATKLISGLHKNKYIFSARSQILIIDENFWGCVFIFFVQEDHGVRAPTGCQLSCVSVRRWGQQRVGNL